MILVIKTNKKNKGSKCDVPQLDRQVNANGEKILYCMQSIFKQIDSKYPMPSYSVTNRQFDSSMRMLHIYNIDIYIYMCVCVCVRLPWFQTCLELKYIMENRNIYIYKEKHFSEIIHPWIHTYTHICSRALDIDMILIINTNIKQRF